MNKYLIYFLLFLVFPVFGFGQGASENSEERMSTTGLSREELGASFRSEGTEVEPKPFGYEHFRTLESDKTSVDVLLLVANYKLGPGDSLGIFIWGKTEINLKLVVGLEGKVYIPHVGAVQAGGLTVSAFKDTLIEIVGKYYRNVSVDCMLLKPRSVTLWVSGEVKKPGKYIASALSTLSQVITLAGGPSERASLRHIKIVRLSGDTLVSDLYGLLAKGDQAQDVRIESGDVVYVPVKGKIVTISGEVKRPAVFELKGGETLLDVVELAGGFTSFAYLEKVQFVKKFQGGERRIEYLDMREHSLPALNPVMFGDEEIYVFTAPWYQAGKKKAYFVTVDGEVRYPGVYNIYEEEPLSEVLKRAGGFTSKADLKNAKFIRPFNPMIEDKELMRIEKIPEKDRSESEKQYVNIKRQQMPSGFIIIDFYKLWVKKDPKQNIGLRDGDIISIPRKIETVALTGSFNNPGSIVFKQGADIQYYIKQAGGLAWNANGRGLRIIKPTGERIRPSRNVVLEPGDVIWAPAKGEFNWWSTMKDISKFTFEIVTIYVLLKQVIK